MLHANLFELHGSGLKVTYSGSSFDGKPQLTYQKGKTAALTFRGPQLQQKQTDIGLLITVVLKTIPDSKTVAFSLLLPQVNLGDDQRQTDVGLKGIETTTRTSIGGPNLVKGQLQTYKVYSLQGVAKSVVF